MNNPQQPQDMAVPVAQSGSNLESVKSAIEMLSKIVLGTAAACFVCGIIVVNLYLREFGVASFSLFRVSYITAGVWTFSPIGFAVLSMGTSFFSYFQDQRMDEKPRTRSSRSKRWVKLIGAVNFALVVLVMIFFGFGIPISWRWSLAIIIGIVIGSSGIAMPMVFRQSKTFREKLLSASGPFFGLVGFLCYLLFLAPSLYKEIPASVGGGAGMPVVFVVPADKQELVKAAGITFAEPFRTDQVILILQTDKEYVVLAGDPKVAITLGADLVSAIRHVSPRK
jgi:hypothetical protein